VEKQTANGSAFATLEMKIEKSFLGVTTLGSNQITIEKIFHLHLNNVYEKTTC
jgi:hypothetical protein